MSLSGLGEFGFIERLRQMVSCHLPALQVPLGDDCAVLEVGAERLAITTDAMVEGRHFRLDWLTPEEIGARAVTASLSDLAAMGAAPLLVLTSLGFPPDWPAERALHLAQGLVDQAERYGACLAGGDTVAAAQAFIDVTAIGMCRPHIWLRSGAEVGDSVYVTGALGGPAAALAARHAGISAGRCWERYARPTPRLREAAQLSPLGLVHAALDLSDGLVQDAGHICDRSGVGMVLQAERVPVYDGVGEIAAALGTDPRQYALAGGEEFELLFTAPPSALPAIQAVVEIPVSRIGEVVAGNAVTVMQDGAEMTLDAVGWDHFAR